MTVKNKAGSPAKRAPGAGRPAKPKGEKLELVPIRFPPAMLEAVDAAREARRDKPDRSAMIRELVGVALDSREKGKAKR